ncbi:HNH endonuclease signature motif containing protein [Streptococcus sp. E29BA]|uniref:HNH endonuclease signature motif containing protein n=1 Tax=Streptococcus sp. E29BA TaxID=3278716 RepID=UPI00359DF733
MARRSLGWKDEYTAYLRDIITGRLIPEVTTLVNGRFGTTYSKVQIAGVCKRLGLSSGKHTHGRSLTKEQHEFLVAINNGRTAKEVAELLNAEFGLSWSAERVKNYRGNHKLKSGLTGQFSKGHVPANKGKKYPGMRNSGQFKKGDKPASYLPVGTINYTTDGYPKIKVAEPNVWEYLHRQTWEKHHGPVPKGYSVVFLDGDKSNWDITNLACLSRSEVVRMNQMHLITDNPELTKAGIGLVKLQNKIREVKNGTTGII